MTVPDYLTCFELTGTAAVVIAILYGLKNAVKLTDWAAPVQMRFFMTGTLLLLVWLTIALVLGYWGVYTGSGNRIPTIQYGIVLPILLGIMLAQKSSRLSLLIDAVPQPWLIGLQLFRVIGVIFLILFADGKLPGQFALPAGIGDLLVGIAAPIVAQRYQADPSRNGSLVKIWNWLGIIDLIVAIGTGFLTSPSPFQQLSLSFPNELISKFPLVMIPTFLVPIAILLHIASLVKLRRSEHVRAAV